MLWEDVRGHGGMRGAVGGCEGCSVMWEDVRGHGGMRGAVGGCEGCSVLWEDVRGHGGIRGAMGGCEGVRMYVILGGNEGVYVSEFITVEGR